MHTLVNFNWAVCLWTVANYMAIPPSPSRLPLHQQFSTAGISIAYYCTLATTYQLKIDDEIIKPNLSGPSSTTSSIGDYVEQDTVDNSSVQQLSGSYWLAIDIWTTSYLLPFWGISPAHFSCCMSVQPRYCGNYYSRSYHFIRDLRQ